MNQPVRRAVAASTASGQIQYQGWNSGARATVAASARPACQSGSRVRARHQSQTSSSASTAMPIPRVTGSASTCAPKGSAR